MSNVIVKSIEMKASVSRVWRALTDSQEFGEWFGVKLQDPFAPGKTCSGHMTIPGYETLAFEVVVQTMTPESLFSYTWHPFALDPEVDYSAEVPTLVEFTLEKTADGTRLQVTESGFEHIPANRRDEAFRMDDAGWAAQMRDIGKYVADNP